MNGEQRAMDLEDCAAALRRVASLRAQELLALERVKVLELQLRDARDLAKNIQYQLRSKLDDVGGEDGPLFRHLDQG